MGRDNMNTNTRLRAVLTSRSLYDLATALEWERRVGRPGVNPPYVTLAYGVLARLQRSGIRVELDLAEPPTWAYARDLMSEAITRYRLDLPLPATTPPTWNHWRWIRDRRLATDEGLAELARVFPPIAVACANRIGLLRGDGPGSLTHPSPQRTVYGDGTLVRPLYNPPETVTITGEDGRPQVVYPDPRSGQLLDAPPHRYDPDLLPHHGRLGPVLTHGYVGWHARGPHPYQRVDLAVAHIAAPGAEAATAVDLLRDVHRAAGNGIHAAVYDGAMRGVHIDQIMRDYGYLVLAKQPTSRAAAGHGTNTVDGQEQTDSGTPLSGSETAMVMTQTGRRARSYPLGTITHQPHDSADSTAGAGRAAGACLHQIAAVNGHVVEIDLDEAGDPVVVSRLTRGPVKRQRRSTGEYHFNVGYELDCPRARCTVWLAPHAGKDHDIRRPENLRVIPADDPDAQRLSGIRSDAESFHAHFKRTLLVNRAMSLGWRRGLVDLYCFALYNNALTEYRQHQLETGQLSGPTARRLTRAPIGRLVAT